MAFQELALTIIPSEYEDISALLEQAGALSVSVTDAKDNPIFEPALNTQPLWDEIILTGLFDKTDNLSPLITLLEHTHQKKPVIKTLPDQDWTKICQNDFQPVCFGEKLWICPSWHAVVTLDPGLAFGTGSHPTTQLCLEWLARHADKLVGKTIIDYGTGSGILAISAMKLGAKKVYAIDIDPQALEAARQNALANHVALEIMSPEAFSEVAKKNNLKADVLLANILANPLIELSPQLLSYLNEKGYIILSGILSTQIEPVCRAYEPMIHFTPPVLQDDWARLEGIKS